MPQLFVLLAFTANGVAFGLIAYGALVVTIRNIQYGTPQLGTLPLATAILGVLVMLASLLPTARQNLTRAISSGWSPMFTRVAVHALIGIVAIAAAIVIKSDAGPILGIVGPDHIFLLTCAYIVLVYVAFVLPGLIFWIEPERRLQARALAATPLRPAFVDPPPRGLAVRAAGLFFGTISVTIALTWVLTAKGTAFLPSPEHSAFVAAYRTQIIIATALAFAGCAMFMRLGHATKGPFRNRSVHRATVVAFFMCASFFGPSAVEMGMPSLHAMMSGVPEATQEVTVLERGKARESKRCRNTAVVTWPGSADYRQILCGIPSDIWQELQPGDRLMVSGPRTRFGQRTDTIVRP